MSCALHAFRHGRTLSALACPLERPLPLPPAQTCCGEDPAARAAIRRGLNRLHTLLPDLRPYWAQQVRVQQVRLDEGPDLRRASQYGCNS